MTCNQPAAEAGETVVDYFAATSASGLRREPHFALAHESPAEGVLRLELGYPLHVRQSADRLIFEVDHDALRASSRRIEKAARYARGDGLKNHVDPRTYAYVRRVFGILKVPEEKPASYKPGFLALILQTPQLHAYPRIWCGRLF